MSIFRSRSGTTEQLALAPVSTTANVSSTNIVWHPNNQSNRGHRDIERKQNWDQLCEVCFVGFEWTLWGRFGRLLETIPRSTPWRPAGAPASCRRRTCGTGSWLDTSGSNPSRSHWQAQLLYTGRTALSHSPVGRTCRQIRPPIQSVSVKCFFFLGWLFPSNDYSTFDSIQTKRILKREFRKYVSLVTLTGKRRFSSDDTMWRMSEFFKRSFIPLKNNPTSEAEGLLLQMLRALHNPPARQLAHCAFVS